jgi:hypothetical protein
MEILTKVFEGNFYPTQVKRYVSFSLVKQQRLMPSSVAAIFNHMLYLMIISEQIRNDFRASSSLRTRNCVNNKIEIC